MEKIIRIKNEYSETVGLYIPSDDGKETLEFKSREKKRVGLDYFIKQIMEIKNSNI